MAENKSTGAAAELAVARELAKEGFTVSFPLGDDGKFDLISCSPDGVTKRIQVKTAAFRADVGTYRVNLTHGTRTKVTYTPDDCDCLAVWLPFADHYKNEVVAGLYIIPVDDAQVYCGTFYPPGTHKHGSHKVCEFEKFRNNLAFLRKK